MAATIHVGEDVYLGEEKVTITSIDDWTRPFRYYFKNKDGQSVYCTRGDLTKRKPKISKDGK